MQFQWARRPRVVSFVRFSFVSLRVLRGQEKAETTQDTKVHEGILLTPDYIQRRASAASTEMD
jgi:hypothetical protein